MSDEDLVRAQEVTVRASGRWSDPLPSHFVPPTAHTSLGSRSRTGRFGMIMRALGHSLVQRRPGTRLDRPPSPREFIGQTNGQ